MLILIFVFQIITTVSGLWTQGGYYCCGNPYQDAMTPSGYPVYGMAPDASSSVAYSGPAPTYSYASFAGNPNYGISNPVSSGYSGYGGYSGSNVGSYSRPSYSNYGNGGYSGSGYGYNGANYAGASYSNYGSGGAGSIDFDSIPSGQIPSGATIGAPVAIRYFNQPIPTVLDPVALKSAAPTNFMRVPIYGIQRSGGTYSQGLTEPAPESYVSKYSKFRQSHSIDSDISRGYQPAYSAWNPQPIQAVFRQASTGITTTVASVKPESAPASSNSYSENQKAIEVVPATETGSYGETTDSVPVAYVPETNPTPVAPVASKYKKFKT